MSRTYTPSVCPHFLFEGCSPIQMTGPVMVHANAWSNYHVVQPSLVTTNCPRDTLPSTFAKPCQAFNSPKNQKPFRQLNIVMRKTSRRLCIDINTRRVCPARR